MSGTTSFAAALMGGTAYVLPNTPQLVVAFTLFLASLNFALADEPAFTINPIPSWVAPIPAFSSSMPVNAESVHGSHNRLNDLQINAIVRGDTRIFRAVEYVLTNPIGVENFSNIEILFNPRYQTLSLHELVVERDQVSVNRLDSAHFDVIPPKSGRPVYNATQTLRTELNELKVGDTIRYSYTLTGENPVFGGLREFHVNTQFWTQLDRQHARILSAAENPLVRRSLGEAVSVSIEEREGVLEMVLDQQDVGEFVTENEVPSWHEAQGVIVFSDLSSWHDVVKWALPLYQLPKASNERVVQIAADIKRSNSSRDGQIGAALRWVQEEIDYYDEELGANSPPPNKAEITLNRGFADSKDKTMLAMAILRELDVEAHAALVNTQPVLEAEDYPYRLLAFNHVLIHVQRNGVSHFIDPSRDGQTGSLGKFFEPDYGRALVLKPDSVDLVSMDDSRSIVQQSVSKELTLPGVWSNLMHTSMDSADDISERAAGLKVVSRKQGLLAEQVRNNLELAGKSVLSKSYLEYYQVLFPSISAVSLGSLDDSETSDTTFVETYTINEFWEVDEKVGEHRWLYADEIISLLDFPSKVEHRERSYELGHPINITETWLVPMSDNVRMLLEEASVENEWVSFSKSISTNEEEKMATITFSYATLTNEVDPGDLEVYVAAVEQINDHASFYLQHAPVLAAAAPTASVPWNIDLVKFWVIFLSVICIAGWIFYVMKNYREKNSSEADEDSAR